MGQKGIHGYKMREGFSLVEVIIAVTVLAILTLPILAYFTNASVSTSKGKNTQRANLAGETVMEELNAVDSFEELEAATGAAWTGTVDETEPNWQKIVKETDDLAVLNRKITIDDHPYFVQAEIDYDYLAGATSSPGINEYNDYEVPDLKPVNSANSIVLEESDQGEIALNEYYYESEYKERSKLVKSTIDKDTVLGKMTRQLCLDVQIDDVVKDGENIKYLKVAVEGYYKFYFEGGNEKRFTIQKSDLSFDSEKNLDVYMFYKALNDKITTENVKITVKNNSGDAGANIKKLNMYLVVQDRKTSGYKLNIEKNINGVTEYKIYSNGNAFGGNCEDTVVEHQQENRIARIKVNVYDYIDSDSSSYSGKDALVTLDSSKSE